MSFSLTFAFYSSVITYLLIASYYYYTSNYYSEDNFDWVEEWWTSEERRDEDVTIHPFKVNISQQEIQDLYLRLNISREFLPSFQDVSHEYGLHHSTLNDLIHFLKHDYDIMARQSYLNTYPQFTANIRGMNVHFLHIKPEATSNQTVVPLLLLHGWCSSVREFFESIEVFGEWSTGKDYVFELTSTPSLPGYGYSDGAKRSKFQLPQMAYLLKTLMNRLGHQKFYVHGSDWGSILATTMSVIYPRSISGIHSSFCFSLRYVTIFKTILASVYPRMLIEAEFVEKMYPLWELFKFALAEFGYFHQMGTKSDTIGHGLDSSIEALIAFNFEKLSVAENKINIRTPSAGLDAYDLTTLMDVTLFYFWFPKKATSAARLYAENVNLDGIANSLQNYPISEEVPCGCAFFEHDFVYQPESFLRDKYRNLIHNTNYKSIGHFAALEANRVLTEDIISFVNKTLVRS